MSSDPLPPPPTATRRRSCLTSLLALIAFLVTAAVLLFLPAGFIGPVFVLGGVLFFGLFALHYLVWGRWLDAELRRMESPTDDQEE